MDIRPVVIGAPFGNYLSFPDATSTIGTFTLHPRGGIVRRLWRCVLTLRPSRKTGGWVNRLGLPNPGIESIEPSQWRDRIISIHGFDPNEWNLLAYILSRKGFGGPVELNLSCPNVNKRHGALEVKGAIESLGPQRVIAKLPPVDWFNLAEPLWNMGVRYFHCCNTIPCHGGGISGKVLKQYSLWATEEIKQKWGEEVTVIGGGGVTSLEDVCDYLRAGASHVSIAGAFLNPLRWPTLRRLTTARFDLTKKDVYFTN